MNTFGLVSDVISSAKNTKLLEQLLNLCCVIGLQQQAAAAAAARAEEEERLAARPQRKAAPRPVRSRAATPSSDSDEFDSPYARYRGRPAAQPSMH